MVLRRKSTLTTFFYVKKAYDSVWHARLIYKLKNIGITSVMFQYFKNFSSKRCICTQIGKTYIHLAKKLIWVCHRAQLLYLSKYLIYNYYTDLWKALSNNTHLAQYADNIAIWVNTTLRKHTNKRVVSHVQKLYQSELNKLIPYIKENGFELSWEKTCLMLFNNGKCPKSLLKQN